MIAWSDYFKSYIRMERKDDNNNWYFYKCNKKGKKKFLSKTMKAQTPFDKFKWELINHMSSESVDKI